MAGRFAEALGYLPDASLAAVCARTTAPAFAERFGIPRHYASVAELVADPDVDVVYVSTPNALHADHCLAALEAGKAVVCEKPFATSGAEARGIVDTARSHGLFCMEAMPMRFLPATRQALEMVRSGVIGEVRMVSANFGHHAAYDPENRFFNPELGGGAFLDAGVYALSLSVMLLGAPQRVTSDAAIGPTGVDVQSAAVLTYADGRLAVLQASLLTQLPSDAAISGIRGEIRLAPLWRPEWLTVRRFGEGQGDGRWRTQLRRLARARKLRPATRHVPYTGDGFNYEAAEAMRCMDAGLLESPLMPLEETIQVMETLDAIRAQWPSA
jgi:predicted dehydrogenase